MRYFALTTALVAAFSTGALGQSIYTGARTVGRQSATVTITTDGTIGAITPANILSFLIDFSNGTSISGDSHNVSNGDQDTMFANSTQLGFNFDQVPGYFAFVGQNATVQNSFYCLQITYGCGVSGTAEVINTYDGYGQATFLPQSGFVPLFTAQSTDSVLPEPAAWAMMLLGFSATACAMRRKRTAILLPQLA